MKVSTKIAAGAGGLVGLLLLTLALDMTLVRDLVSSHRSLSEHRFVAVTSTLEILRTLEVSEERLQKFVITRDAAYAEKLDSLAATLEGQLAQQRQLALPPRERLVADAVSARWADYRATFDARRAEIIAAGPINKESLRLELLEKVNAVRAQAVSLLAELRTGIDGDVREAQRDATVRERLSWLVAAVAVLGAVLFVLQTLRSLNGPLGRLLDATRRVATGSFSKVSLEGSDELAELARAFDLMVERLDELDRMKRDFISHISHELKTPLSAMQETNQLLIEELAGPLTPKQRRLLQLNLDAGRRLSAMLSRLLDISRLEAGAVTYDVRPVAIEGLVSTAYQEFEARLREKRISSELRLPEQSAVVDADPDWLVQVFANLLENAIKFSPPDRRLWLELRPATPADFADAPDEARERLSTRPGVLVTVADEGPGIPEEVRDRVFERFFQVAQSRRAGSGVGLGLAICRGIVAAHGGALWVANRAEGGTVFTVALPLSSQQSGSLESSVPSPHADASSALVDGARPRAAAGRV